MAVWSRDRSSASAAFRLLLEILSPLWPLTFEAERRKMCPRVSHRGWAQIPEFQPLPRLARLARELATFPSPISLALKQGRDGQSRD